MAPLAFSNPRLWFPLGLGPQPLYTVDLSLEIDGSDRVSHSWSHKFGFRQIESFVDPTLKGRVFRVNGFPVFIRGGNWIASDGMLRCSAERYETEIAFHAVANLNMLRVWGGGLTERPEFYDECDKRGILVWQEFWITGDCNGRGLPPSDPTWPLDHKLFLSCATDAVKMLRNHASLALWVGGNEAQPPKALNLALENLLALDPALNPALDPSPSLNLPEPWKSSERQGTLNPEPREEGRPPLPPPAVSLPLDGTRSYVAGSLWGGFGEGSGQFSDGPYGILNPADPFAPGFYRYAFNPEVGSVGLPEASTVRAVLEPRHWAPPERKKKTNGRRQGLRKEEEEEEEEEEDEEVVNEGWQYHTYIPYSAPGKVPCQVASYGVPAGLDDFCQKAQIVNFCQYRALLESWNALMWTSRSGVLLWKSQNPWTGFRGQLYDCQLDVTGGAYGARLAGERVHVQMNPWDRFVQVVNSGPEELDNVSLAAAIFNLDGRCPVKSTFAELTAKPFTTSRVFQVPDCSCLGASPVYFLLLSLVDSNGSLLSRNIYWLHSNGTPDYKLLDADFRARKVPVSVKILSHKTRKSQTVLHVQLANGGPPAVPLLELHVTEGSAESSSIFPTSSQQHICREELKDLSGGVAGVAFFLRLSVHSVEQDSGTLGDGRVLGVIYSENYVSLVPGESMDVELSFKHPKDEGLELRMRGWNVEDVVVSLP